MFQKAINQYAVHNTYRKCRVKKSVLWFCEPNHRVLKIFSHGMGLNLKSNMVPKIIRLGSMNLVHRFTQFLNSEKV